MEQRAKGPGYEHITQRIGTVFNGLFNDYKSGKDFKWNVLKPDFVHKVWDDFINKGYVSDESKLDTIFNTIRDNVVILVITSSVSSHSKVPVDMLDDQLANISVEQSEKFFKWLTGENYNKNISDFGTEPLFHAVALAFEAKTYKEKLKHLDRALHITHSRGDLSLFFIQGGRGIDLHLEKDNIKKLKM